MSTVAKFDQREASVVVIGGGIGGCCVAYHLADLGLKNVLLLERSMLSSGTTWHSTGNMETYRDDPLIFEMVRYAAEIYPKLATKLKCDIGWRNVGRVMYTDNEERWQVLQTLPELGRARGIELELLQPRGLVDRLPIIAADELIGGIWVPSDARVNPTDAVMLFANAAKQRGVKIHSDCEVSRILMRDGVVQGVETKAGVIHCETVVVAAGMWSAEILRSSDLALPLYALEHQYIMTNSQGVDRNLPLFLSFDDHLYGREEVGGLMIGSLDDNAIPLSLSELPQNFSFALLSERWDQFEPYLQTAMRRFPTLRTATIKMLLNGPESFTPDGQMLLGPAPGMSGLYVSCGFNSNGMALAPAAGRYIAEWIVDGAPSADVAKLDARRFSAVQCDENYLRERVTEIPAYHCRLHAPGEDFTTARNVRCSPLHSQLAAAGAQFSPVAAWETPVWFTSSRDSAAGSWLDSVAQEAKAAAQAVLVVDRSTDVKILVEQPEAFECLVEKGSHLWPQSTLVRPLTGGVGEVEALVRRLPEATGRLLVTSSPDQSTRVLEWFRIVAKHASIAYSDVTGAYAILELLGPKRREFVDRLRSVLCAGLDDWQASRIDGAALSVHEDVLGGSTWMTMPTGAAERLWPHLVSVGKEFDLRAGGTFACEAIRIDRGIPTFGREASPARFVRELAPGAPRYTSEGGAAAPRTHRNGVLVPFSSSLPLLGFGGREAVLLRGDTVGEITSRVRLSGWPAALALGIVDLGVREEDGLEFVCDGKRWPLVRRQSKWDSSR